MDDLRHRMDVAADAAWRAGKLTLSYFQTGLAVETKADRSPVTAADREAEATLVERLRREFPRDGVLGEEKGEIVGSSGFRWILDPIDATCSFIRGVPLYGVTVGLEGPGGEALVGVIYLPALEELVVAGRGEGCYWNGRRTHVSSVSSLEEACVVYTGDECFEETGTLDVPPRLREHVRLQRSWGDCYGHVLVATGRAEAMLDPVLDLWDAASLLPIVEEAGGVFTDWTGARTIHGRSGVSTNRALATELRALLGGE